MSNEHYFLGASSSEGFCSGAEDLVSDKGNNIFILKGTAGSGKSTLMKKIAEAFSEEEPVLFHCSSDPGSLDGVYIRSKRVFVLDGTAPHCYDPVYPKAVETMVDLGAYIGSGQIRQNKTDIIKLTDHYSTFHKRCRSCLSAISSVFKDIAATAFSCVDVPKLDLFAERTSRRIIPKTKTKKGSGKLHFRQLSAVTMNGYSTYLPEKYHIYRLSDETAAASSYFLSKLAAQALSKGYDVLVSRCLLSQSRFYEHMIIPEIKLAFVTSSFFNPLNSEKYEKHIRFKRFYNTGIEDEYQKKRIKFGEKTVLSLISEISSELASAKDVHDKIEEYYIKSADFDGLNRLAFKLISEIKSL